MMRTAEQLRAWFAFTTTYVDANPGNARGRYNTAARANTPRITPADTDRVVRIARLLPRPTRGFASLLDRIRGAGPPARKKLRRRLVQELESLEDNRPRSKRTRARRRMVRFLREERAAGRSPTRAEIEADAIAEAEVTQAEIDAALVEQYDLMVSLGLLDAR